MFSTPAIMRNENISYNEQASPHGMTMQGSASSTLSPQRSATFDSHPNHHILAAGAAAAEAASVIFPQKLMDILNAVDSITGQPRFYDTIRWTIDGMAFKIEDRLKLASHVLPIFFGAEAEFRSFTRRLLRWGFRRILKKGTDSHGAFFHKLFRKDNPALCRQIQTKEQIKMAIKRNAKRLKENEQINMAIQRDDNKMSEKDSMPFNSDRETKNKAHSKDDVGSKEMTVAQREAAMSLVHLSDGGINKRSSSDLSSGEAAKPECKLNDKESSKGNATKDCTANPSTSHHALLNSVFTSRNKKLKKSCGNTELVKIKSEETTHYQQKPFVDVTTFPFTRVNACFKQPVEANGSKEFDVEILSEYKDTLRKKQEKEGKGPLANDAKGGVVRREPHEMMRSMSTEVEPAARAPAANLTFSRKNRNINQQSENQVKRRDVARSALMAQMFEKERALEHQKHQMHQKQVQDNHHIDLKSIGERNGEASNGRSTILGPSMAYHGNQKFLIMPIMDEPDRLPGVSSQTSSSATFSTQDPRRIAFEASKGMQRNPRMPIQEAPMKSLADVAPVHNMYSDYGMVDALSRIEKIPGASNFNFSNSASPMESGMEHEHAWLEGLVEEQRLKKELDRLVQRNQQMGWHAAFHARNMSPAARVAGMPNHGHEYLPERLHSGRSFIPHAGDHDSFIRHQQGAFVDQNLPSINKPNGEHSNLLTVSQILADRISQTYYK